MSELLSQEEIDALFSALDSGELDVEDIKDEPNERVIKDYNFARPTKFSREHLRTLQNMCENYGRLVSNYMTGYLRTPVPIKVQSAEAMTFAEFNTALSNPVVLAVMDVKPLSGSMILELSPNVCFGFMERILGGVGGKEMSSLREFTAIEHTIIDRVLQKFTGFLKEPWENVIELRPRLNRVETNSQFVNLVSPNEMVALITFTISIGEIEGLMNLCIPHIVIEPVMDKINSRFRFETQNDNEDEELDDSMEHLIRGSSVILKAILGNTTVTVQEFLDLQVNDIIKLDREINSCIDVYVGNTLKFRGNPGVFKNKSAIQIQKVIIKEED